MGLPRGYRTDRRSGLLEAATPALRRKPRLRSADFHRPSARTTPTKPAIEFRESAPLVLVAEEHQLPARRRRPPANGRDHDVAVSAPLIPPRRTARHQPERTPSMTPAELQKGRSRSRIPGCLPKSRRRIARITLREAEAGFLAGRGDEPAEQGTSRRPVTSRPEYLTELPKGYRAGDDSRSRSAARRTHRRVRG